MSVILQGFKAVWRVVTQGYGVTQGPAPTIVQPTRAIATASANAASPEASTNSVAIT